MPNRYLTKSDFKVAQTCPTKLYYRKLGYPTREDGDEYLQALAEGGYLIEALARALFPDGRWVGYRDDVESAVWDTMTALAADPTTLFEATFVSGARMARADILLKRGRTLELIEIKSCGFDRQANDAQLAAGQRNLFYSPRSPDGLKAAWRPYIEDAAFQVSILQDVFPDMDIVPYLLMPDTSRPCSIDGLHHRFTLRSVAGYLDAGQRPAADYNGDARELHRGLFLTRVDVSQEVSRVLPAVRQAAEGYVADLLPALRRRPGTLAVGCRQCEYRVSEGDQRGFHECWGALGDAQPHILDLYHISNLSGRQKPLANELIAAGRVSLFDIPEQRLVRSDGALGEVAQRQRRQIAAARQNREWQAEELAALLAALPYPHYFLDFETCTPAVPRYRGMRPFEVIAYQWACQTVTAPDAPPRHSEWLQPTDTYPNSAFAASLRRQLGDEGAILVWGSHEKTVLKTIQRQMDERGETDTEVYAWLGRTLADDRLVDMCQLTLRHYIHPRMGGSTSLKQVADAVWQSDAAVRARLPQYAQATDDGWASPYAALPPLLVGKRSVSVSEGTGAMLAYFSMMERAAAGATLEAGQWRRLLLQYCQLDTLAMVMVWWHWRGRTAG
ncbi:MAG TPA: DUF2779 domain-containing protein [Promineifilum sp.]|nr:DUF2779 domain-containing protein [Promineifilum sp.]